MGKAARRFFEGVRQKLISDPNFPTTSNERNLRMLHEAEVFARCVRNVYFQLKRLENTMAGLGLNVRGLLESPLPRPYVITEAGEVAPETIEVEIVGSGVQVERITTASQVMQVRLHEEVHTPLQQWLSAYDATKALLRQVEGLKLELDSRKRTVLKLKEKLNRARGKLEKGSDGVQQSLTELEAKLNHKEEKCANCKAEFVEQEQRCSDALWTLLKDSSNLQHFLAQAYKVIHQTSWEAYGGFVNSGQNTPRRYVVADAVPHNINVAHTDMVPQQ